MSTRFQRALAGLGLSMAALSAMANEPAMAVQRPLNLNLPGYSGMASPSQQGPWLDTAQRGASPTHSSLPLPYGSGFENRPNSRAPQASNTSGHSPQHGGNGQGRGQGRGR